MKSSLALITAAIVVIFTSIASAQNVKYVEYNVRNAKFPVVKGKLAVGGYTWAEVTRFIAADCASGKIGPIKTKGKPSNVGKLMNDRVIAIRSFQIQKFRTTCEGGANLELGFGRSISVNINADKKGRNRAEYLYIDRVCCSTAIRYRK